MKFVVSKKTFVGVLLSTLMVSASASAQKAASPKDAKDIVKAVIEKGAFGFKQGTATLEMTITKKSGSQKSNTLAVKALKNEAGLLRSLMTFEKPVVGAGMAFLVRENKDALPDQYVYVPAAKVVRQISAGKANGSFFGSDFTYGDLMPLPENQQKNIELKRLADAKVGGQDTYVVEMVPKIEGSPYKKLAVYVHQTHLVPLKIEFFENDKAPLKTLTTKKLQKVGSDYLPVDIEMVNHKKGSSTRLKVTTLDPNAKLSEADFTQEAMRR